MLCEKQFSIWKDVYESVILKIEVVELCVVKSSKDAFQIWARGVHGLGSLSPTCIRLGLDK